MIKDYNLFIKNARQITSRNFDLFAFSNGLEIRILPLDDAISHSGFLPFNLRATFIDGLIGGDSFMSGFEIYFNRFEPDLHDDSVGKLASGSEYEVMIAIDGTDSFQELLGLVYSAFLCKYCNGIMYDPQSDKSYTTLDEIEKLIAFEKNRLALLAKNEKLNVHNFEGWK
ncbi:MAG: hypothetical protein IJ002_02725 [Clostridia bacterium]|nr:hypothetical protein [Clostridia bacterium]